MDIFGKIDRQLALKRRLGWGAYLRWRFSAKGARVEIILEGHKIFVRKGTPDLGIAISCLTGEFEALRYLLASNYSGTIIDAGGYIGTATLVLRKMFPNAKIVVIEPSSDNITMLKSNLKGVSNVEVIEGALIGTSEATVTLSNRETGESGFTVVSKPSDKPDAAAIEETKAVRLADFIERGDKIGLLKLDIEGGEMSLLQNDMETMQSIGVVFAELHDRIVPGCVEKYFDFSRDRILIKHEGEKYLSVSRQLESQSV